jgi:hypothetical protein
MLDYQQLGIKHGRPGIHCCRAGPYRMHSAGQSVETILEIHKSGLGTRCTGWPIINRQWTLLCIIAASNWWRGGFTVAHMSQPLNRVALDYLAYTLRILTCFDVRGRTGLGLAWPQSSSYAIAALPWFCNVWKHLVYSFIARLPTLFLGHESALPAEPLLCPQMPYHCTWTPKFRP